MTARPPSPLSQYLDGLNMIPSATSTTFEDEAALFPSPNYFDFDIGNSLSTYPDNMNMPSPEVAPSNVAALNALGDSVNPFSEFTHFSPSSHAALSLMGNSPFPSLPSTAQSSLKSSPANGIQGGHPSLQSRPTVPSYSHFEKHFQGIGTADPQVGQKRSSVAASLPSVQDMEEESRVAAEEDKRRRNTAASARFRVKKKQREQALERSAKDMTGKLQRLESRVNELEMENKWLRGLLVERKVADRSVVDDEVGSGVQASDLGAKAASKNAALDLSNQVTDQIEMQHRKRGIGTA